MTRMQYKKEAGNKLHERTLRAFRISLCTAVTAVLFGLAAYAVPIVFPQAAEYGGQLLSVQIAVLVLAVGLLGSMRQGRTAWMYCCACGKEPSGLQFRYWLRRGRGFRAALLTLDIRVRKIFWTLLLCVPGVGVLSAAVQYSSDQTCVIGVITWIGGALCLTIGLFFAAWINQKYALAPILFARAPQKGVRSAVRASGFLMEDSCLRLFALKLSFLPWFILCAAVFPIVYVLPYYQMTTVCMLREILRRHTI